MRRILALLLALAAPAALAATPIPPGKWSFEFRDAHGPADRPVRVYTYRPRQCDTTCPILFVMHDGRRDGYRSMAPWELAADRHGFLVAAPEFPARHWPGAAGYALGAVAGAPDREKWALSAVEHLFDEVRDGQEGYAIFGNGAGAQFVHRLALLRADHRATALVAADAGWYAMPEWRKDKVKSAYPYSLAGTAAGEAEVRRALQRRLLVLVGGDGGPDEDGLGASGAAKAQGETPLDRAESFIKAATAAAQALGVPLAWELHELPATARDEALARHAAALIFGKR